jgi:hypothetical protein
MSGAVPRRTLDSGATPNRPLLAPAGISCWPSSTPPCRARFRRPIHNNKTADPIHGSAVTSIAATGMPPEPHEREHKYTRSRSKKRLSGGAAPRVRQYEAGPATRRTRARCEGARSERDARLRQAEGSGLSYTVTDRTRDAASQPLGGCPRSATVRNAGRGIA